MQLLMYSDYALRALIYIASHPDEPIPASRIARAYDISPDHVAKATKMLTREGWLRARRGAGGGVELARPAADISIGAIVRLFEGEQGLVDCLSPKPTTCRIAPVCRLKRALQRAERAFYEELDRCTLADLIDNRPQLVRLLRLAPEPP